MKALLKILSFLGLLLTVVPSLLVFNGSMDSSEHKMYMLAGTVLWFITAPFWLGKEVQ